MIGCPAVPANKSYATAKKLYPVTCRSCGCKCLAQGRQRRYCDDCASERRREQQRAADARRRSARRASQITCADCGSVVLGDTRRKYCDACVTERRRAGQVRRWATTPPRQRRQCALGGCDTEVVEPARYCSREHYHRSRRGTSRPDLRQGRVAHCECDLAAHGHDGWCGTAIGYMRQSRLTRASRHVCGACITDWRRAYVRRPASVPYGECGHIVGKPGTSRCIECYRAAPTRGSYKGDRIARAIAELQACGEEATITKVAAIAGVTRQTVYAYRRSGGQRVPVVAYHPQMGTPAGYKLHLRRGETPCKSCRDAHLARRRERYRERKGGLPRRERYDRARCGTTSGYVRHRRRGEPICDRCAVAQKEYDRARRLRGARRR